MRLYYEESVMKRGDSEKGEEGKYTIYTARLALVPLYLSRIIEINPCTARIQQEP